MAKLRVCASKRGTKRLSELVKISEERKRPSRAAAIASEKASRAIIQVLHLLKLNFTLVYLNISRFILCSFTHTLLNVHNTKPLEVWKLPKGMVSPQKLQRLVSLYLCCFLKVIVRPHHRVANGRLLMLSIKIYIFSFGLLAGKQRVPTRRRKDNKSEESDQNLEENTVKQTRSKRVEVKPTKQECWMPQQHRKGHCQLLLMPVTTLLQAQMFKKTIYYGKHKTEGETYRSWVTTRGVYYLFMMIAIISRAIFSFTL
uniref:Transmembrane protein n=1 Tax=Heterorhabditis bacteriophora TaxID=37862 RepID=A0A1I7WK58_HETBA